MLTEAVREVRTPIRRRLSVRFKIDFEISNSGLGLNYTAPIYDKLSSLWLKVNELAPPPEEDDETLKEWDADVDSIRAVINRIEVPDEPVVKDKPSDIISLPEVNTSSKRKKF